MVVAVWLCLSSSCSMRQNTASSHLQKNIQNTIVFLPSPVLPTVRSWHWAMPVRITSTMCRTISISFLAVRQTMVRHGAIISWFSKVQKMRVPDVNTGMAMATVQLPRSLTVLWLLPLSTALVFQVVPAMLLLMWYGRGAATTARAGVRNLWWIRISTMVIVAISPQVTSAWARKAISKAKLWWVCAQAHLQIMATLCRRPRTAFTAWLMILIRTLGQMLKLANRNTLEIISRT